MGRKKVEYICKKCGYKTNKKGHYLNHVSRKTPCDKSDKIIEIHKCEFCNKEYCNKNSLYSHLKICKVKKNISIYKEKLDKENNELKLKNAKYKLKNKELENKLEKKDESMKELITTNKNLSIETKNLKNSIKINMTMHNYFIVNSFGKEETNYIDMMKLINDSKSLAQMVAKQIKLKHFSEFKKNHNLVLLRTIAKTYNKEGIWETKDNLKLFLVNELIKKGVVNIDDYKQNKNIIFEKNKEKKYKKDKKYLTKNIPLPCMFNPVEASKRLKEIQEQRKIDIDPKDEQWDNIEKKYKKEVKTAKRQLDVKNHLIENLKESIKNKHIKAGMVTFKNY